MENGCDKVIQFAFLRSSGSAVWDAATSFYFNLFITEGAVVSSLNSCYFCSISVLSLRQQNGEDELFRNA